MDAFEQRVERLERELRRWRLVACVAGGAMALAVLTGATAPRKAPEELRARKIILVDAQGRATGALSATALLLRHEGSEIRLEVAAAGPAPRPQAKEQGGRPRATADGAPSLTLVRRSTPRAVLRVDEKGSGLALHDAEGVRRAAVGHATIEYPLTGRIEELPEGSVAIFDKRGRMEWQAPEAVKRP